MRADTDGKRIWLTFRYDHRDVGLVRAIPGARWSPSHRAWSLPLDLKVARTLAEEFGTHLQPSARLRAWSKRATREERRLRRAVTAADAKLERVSPELAQYLRPYQRADVRFMAERSCVNANQPGLGKTTEVLAATIEAGLQDRPHLVISPVVSLQTVWEPSVAALLGSETFAGTTPAQRARAMEEGREAVLVEGRPAWVMINPESFKLERNVGWMAQVAWGSVTVDEFHGLGLNNPKTALHVALHRLQAERKWPLSGTPLGGIPLSLWAALRWIDPDGFGSQWRWAKQWLAAETNHFGTKFGGIQPGREREFYQTHAPWLLRRRKEEVAPELPPKTYRDVWVPMRPAQRRQYDRFIADAELRLSGQSLIATSTLAERQRLKLIALSSTKMEGRRHLPTPDSPKLEALLANIQHHAGESTLVFTQFRRVAELTAEYLCGRGLDVRTLHGKTKDRPQLVQDFQAGRFQVFVIVTKAAGFSLTLDRADSVHLLDQTENPADSEQAEDRAHRISRIHNVTVYRYFTRDSIDEETAARNAQKRATDHAVLDQHRDS